MKTISIKETIIAEMSNARIRVDVEEGEYVEMYISYPSEKIEL